MTQEIFDALAAPFAPDKISWRVGSVKKDGTAAMALAYIDARDVMDRLDAVCGPGNWQDRYPHVDKKTVCEIDIYIEGRGWVTKADGAGDSDIEAEKGALSDAFKRAAVRWGVGRYLYHLPSPWVQIDQYKKILPTEMSKLEALLRRVAPKVTPQTPEPATANGPRDAAPPEDEGRDDSSGRKRAAQAKRDGDDETIKGEIAALDMKGLADFNADFDRLTAHLPMSWLDPVRDMLEARFIEIGGTARVADGEAELDEGFRQAVGPGGGRSAPLAGDRRPVERAA